MQPLTGLNILVLAVNIPGPVAASRLARLGAKVTKVEPPNGDPLQPETPAWYTELNRGIEVVRLDLKSQGGRNQLEQFLEQSDLLLTSYRPTSLKRVGLEWDKLETRFPKLLQVLITGEAPPHENRPGHDLTYQARLGLLTPPVLPRILIADLSGAEQAVSAALALLLGRARGDKSRLATVNLAEAACCFAEPFQQGLTAQGGVLGGGYCGYNVYRARDKWVALAALESHFLKSLCRELGLAEPSREAFEIEFATRTAAEWELWADARGIPLVAVQ